MHVTQNIHFQYNIQSEQNWKTWTEARLEHYWYKAVWTILVRLNNHSKIVDTYSHMCMTYIKSSHNSNPDFKTLRYEKSLFLQIQVVTTVVLRRKCSMLQLKLLWFNLDSDLLAKTYSFNPIENGLNILYNLSKSRFTIPMIQSRFWSLIPVYQCVTGWCLGFIARAVFYEKIDTFAAHTTNLHFTALVSWVCQCWISESH